MADEPSNGSHIPNPFKGMKKWQIYTAVGGGVAIGGYMVVRHHSSTGSWNPWSTASNTGGDNSGSATNPQTGMPYSQDNQVDPQTGQTYLAESNEYGSVTAAEAALSAFGQSTATGSGIGVNPASPAPTGTVNPVQGTTQYTSNAAWAQAVTAGLTDVGFNGASLAEALGKYLTSSPMSADDAKLVNTAIAEYGNPPIGNLQVIIAPTQGSGSGTASTVPIVTNGHVVSATDAGATIAWDGSNAVKYVVTLVGPGKNNGKVATLTKPQAVYGGLDADHTYEVHVLPYNNSGTPGKVATIDFKTLESNKKK